ncbi:MAG: hypothetical protein DRJ03_20465 [Chloroflexi bacterium]|nr:MAG: hypothetical protein DRJ03_20465 [Chloroflexota bacterium]
MTSVLPAIPHDIELFRKMSKRKIAIGFRTIPDPDDPDSSFEAKFFQLRDVTDPRRHVIINFDMNGRLINIELGRKLLGNEVKILERSFDGEFYIYISNCENLKPGHDGVYYYYDYYHENVCKDSRIAEILVRSISRLLNDIYERHYKTTEDMKFIELKITEDEIDESNEIEEIPLNFVEILENARVIYNWEGLMKEKFSLKEVYPTPISVVPPEVRPDQNPIFAIIQITQGCWIQEARGPCKFCASYRGIPYREKSLDELIEHIKKVKKFTGRGWKQVRKLFLTDADPFHTKIDSEVYLRFLSREIPQAVWYEAFVSTPTILSKSETLWKRLKTLGLKRLYWGVESADDETLELLGKPHRRKDLYKAAYRLNSSGISYAIIIMSGIGALNPNRSEDEVVNNPHVKETGKFVRDIRCPIVYVSKFMPQPGTEIFDLMQSGELKPLSPLELEKQHRALIKACKSDYNCEVRGGYGVQFIYPSLLR